jgi:hypothetical protein
MPISIAVGEEAIAAANAEEEVVEEPKPQASLELKIRKSMDGNLMITDHIDIDVIIMPGSNKVLVVAKEHLTEDVYDSQDRFFKYLGKKGLIDLSSVRSGNVYGSMEGKYIAETFNGADPVQTITFGIGKFMNEERPYFMYSSRMADEETDRVTEPDNTTSLGDVEHRVSKGSVPIDPTGGLYGNLRGTIGMFESTEKE